jgi:hypothetical protein
MKRHTPSEWSKRCAYDPEQKAVFQRAAQGTHNAFRLRLAATRGVLLPGVMYSVSTLLSLGRPCNTRRDGRDLIAG